MLLASNIQNIYLGQGLFPYQSQRVYMFYSYLSVMEIKLQLDK